MENNNDIIISSDNNNNEIERLMGVFKEKMNTHPQLSTVWYNYLKKQNEKIKELVTQGNSVINNMDKTADISIQSILISILIKDGILL